MTTPRKLFVALFVSTLAFTISAQDRPTGAPATPMADASVPHDCVKPKARHDHGAEKGMPTPKSIIDPCVTSAPASAPKAKTKPRHDHAKFHKNQ